VTQLNESNFFDNVGGSGAPSAKLQRPDDFVVGQVVEQFMTVATDFSTKKPKVDAKTGKEIEQLVIILQTDQTNWAGVTKIPKVDKDDASSADKPASEDDGRRAVYVEPWTNIHAAVGKAVKDANNGQAGPVKNGARLRPPSPRPRRPRRLRPLRLRRTPGPVSPLRVAPSPRSEPNADASSGPVPCGGGAVRSS
jgi:hypothetical protein